MLTYLLFIVGFFILIKGADLLVDGAASLAKRFHVSDLVIGLTIVAFGTSAPELIVNVFASYKGNTELAITNVLGSNIANTFLGLGIAAIIFPLIVQRSTVINAIPLSLLAAMVTGILANDFIIDHISPSLISRIDGLILICFFIIFFSYTLHLAKEKQEPAGEITQVMPVWKSMVFIASGLVGLTFGGDWIVNGAVKMALALGMSQALIGLTIVAVGTSLPEIVTCAVSALKRKNDIAIGNVVGSNIFNIFWVLGISATIRPLDFDLKINFDVWINILAALLLFLFLYISNKTHTLKRVHGILFSVLYVVYIVFAVLRG